MGVIKHQLIICFSALLLIIEQINNNDFNENLGISNVADMAKVIKNDFEYNSNIITLIQRSIDYSKLISNDLIEKLLFFNSYISFNEIEIFNRQFRLIYLQILYQLVINKKSLPMVADLDFVNILNILYENNINVGDFDFVVALVIFYKLISFDISGMSGFITKSFDNYVELSNKRSNLLKYIQIIVAKIMNDSQYGDSISNKIKEVCYCYFYCSC